MSGQGTTTCAIPGGFVLDPQVAKEHKRALPYIFKWAKPASMTCADEGVPLKPGQCRHLCVGSLLAVVMKTLVKWYMRYLRKTQYTVTL